MPQDMTMGSRSMPQRDRKPKTPERLGEGGTWSNQVYLSKWKILPNLRRRRWWDVSWRGGKQKSYKQMSKNSTELFVESSLEWDQGIWRHLHKLLRSTQDTVKWDLTVNPNFQHTESATFRHSSRSFARLDHSFNSGPKEATVKKNFSTWKSPLKTFTIVFHGAPENKPVAFIQPHETLPMLKFGPFKELSEFVLLSTFQLQILDLLGYKSSGFLRILNEFLVIPHPIFRWKSSKRRWQRLEIGDEIIPFLHRQGIREITRIIYENHAHRVEWHHIFIP